MPICVAGMHRSGTSLVARLLRAAGLYLGKDSELLGGGPGNAEGHWEHLGFLELNDAILEAAGGRWDRVPPFEDGWEFDPKFDALVERGAALVAAFRGHEPWGWKDPRNSLTLPFWRRFLPELHVIICVRNPLEVAQSLALRNGLPMPMGVALWADYSARLAAAAPHGRRLVTHYDSYFLDFRAEAGRLARFARLPADESLLAMLSALAKDDLRHNRLPLRDFLDGRIQHDIVEVYLDLCAEAGPVLELAHLAHMFDALDPAPARGEARGDPASRLGRIAIQKIQAHRLLADLRCQIDQAAESLRAAQAETEAQRRNTEAERRRAETLREQLTWKRYRWADWAAHAWHKVLPRKPT
jgi:hypothetical protein